MNINSIFPSLKQARSRTETSKIINNIFKLDASLKTFGKNKKYFIRTYGCQSNIRDGEILSGILEKMGYKQAKDIKQADLVILNTCAVRENAEKKVFGEIGFLKSILSKKPDFIFGITGCMAQEEKNVERIMKQHKHVNFVLGTHNIYELPYILQQTKEVHEQIIRVFSKEGDIVENLPTIRNSKIKAFVNIQYGCDKFCSYCIVPYTRGKVRSREPKEILKEVKGLTKQGYKEVTLLGQNVNSYGVDRKDGYNFVNLLEDVAKTKIDRVRFTTSNPWNFKKEIIDLYAKYDNLMPAFHLPIQSGDETILKKMNRQMKIADYIKLIDYIREKLPEASISTDLIVGFPNESDEQFENTIKLYNKVKYDNAYTFIYSKRNGTPAATMEDSVSMNIKEERLNRLNELVRKYSKQNTTRWVGKIIKVLVEGKSKTNKNILFGYSPDQKVVNFKGKAKIGTIANVYIESASRFSLNGKLKK